MAAELNGKRLELLRDFIPDLRRVAIVANPEHPGEHLERDYSETTGRRLAIDVTIIRRALLANSRRPSPRWLQIGHRPFLSLPMASLSRTAKASSISD